MANAERAEQAGLPGRPRRDRQGVRFALGFLAWVLAFALVLQFDAVTLGFVRPYTERIARAAGFALDLMGERTRVQGTLLHSPRFAVNIYHGCNGLLATSIYLAAVLAFPATWRERAIGAAIGIPAIQVLNLLRILTLYYIGIHWPGVFAAAHGYVWQSIVILLSMAVWIYWAERFVRLDREAAR
jgi:exosortase H (IPTLxxWG-CTERM-specific)